MTHEYLVTMNFSGTILSTDAVRKAERTERACSDSGHHAQSVCSLEIDFDAQILAALSAAVKPAKVAILQDDVRYFTGEIPPTWQVKDRGATCGSMPDTDPISIEVVDSSNDLAYELSDDDAVAWENQTICDPIHPESSLVHRLIAKTGYDLVAITTVIPTVIPAYAANSGKVGDLLDEILHPYGLTWTMDLFDQVILQPWHFDDPEAVAIPSDTAPNEERLKADFQAQKIEREADAVELTWWTQKVKNQALLFMADLPFGEDNLRSGYPIQPGFLWPDEANVEETWFEYQDTALANTIKNGKKVKSKDFTQIILTKNHTLDVSVEEGIVPSGTHVFQNKRAKVAFSNPTAASKRIFYCDIYGDVFYRAAANKVTARVTPFGKNIKAIECTSIVNQADADKAVSMLADLYRAPFRITCSSTTEYPKGAVAPVSDPYMGVVNVICLIVERRFDPSTDEWTYKCVTLKPLVIDIEARASHVLENAPKTKDEDPRIQALSTRSGITGILTNVSHIVPTNKDGSGGNFAGCDTTMSVIVGKADDSANWNFTALPSAGVTGSLLGRTYTVTAMSTDTGYVDITATRALRPIVTLRFSIAKGKQGLDGTASTVYSLIPSAKAISRSILGAYTPAQISAQAIAQTGNADPVAYAGRFLVQESTDGTNYVTVYDSDINESSISHTPSAGIKAIRIRLYRSGGFTVFLDESVIPIVNDGQTGSQGAQGPSVTVIAPSTVFRGMPGMGFSPTSVILSLALNGIVANTYQWQEHNGTSWQAISGATAATYTVSQAVVESSKSYRCVINGTFVSQAVTLTKTIVDRANLMDLSGWVPGGAMPPTGYTVSGTVAENVLEAMLDSYDGSDVGWKCGADAAADADGGFFYLFPCNPSKTYRFIVYVRKNNAAVNGRTYLGCSESSTENLDGTVNTNPYFFSPQLISGSDYILVGVIHPAGYTGGNSGLAGVYDAKTFVKIGTGVEFRMKAGVVDQKMRAFLYSSTNIAEYQWLWRPMIHEIQEKELTKDVLMLACQMEFKAHSAFIGSLMGQEAFFDKLTASEFFVEKLAAKVIQFQESVGSISAQNPVAGDFLAYLGKDPRRQGDASRIFELAIKEYIGNNGGSGYQEEWMSHFLTKKSGNTIGLILAGVLSACSGVKSNPGMIWMSKAHPFGTDDIFEVSCGAGTCMAVGAFGKMARSTDHGDTWGSLITNPFSSSVAIKKVAYNNGVWIAVGRYQVARSTDGGITWSLVSIPDSLEYLSGTGIAYGNGVWIISFSGTPGKVIRSTDNGLTWNLISVSAFSSFSIYAVTFANGIFILGGAGGIISRSTDNGLTWSAAISNPIGAQINFISSGNGVILVGGNFSRLSRSTDGGLTWSPLIQVPVTDNTLKDGKYGNGIWIISAYSGTIIRSSDNGKTWNEATQNKAYQPFGSSAIWMTICFDDVKNRFIAAGDNGASESYIITSDWLEAGAGIVEAGSNSSGQFFKLAIGLTVQFGTRAANQPATVSRVVTLPVPFANINYFAWSVADLAIASWGYGNVAIHGILIHTKTTEGFSILTTYLQWMANNDIRNGSFTEPVGWIAIGPTA